MFRKTAKPKSPASRSASLLAFVFALIAVATSATGAYMIAEASHVAVPIVLMAVSLACVLYEKSALTWIAARRQRKDSRAVGLGVFFLVAAAVYTAIMQLTFFGTIMLKQVSADEAAAAELANINTAINSLETRRSWQPKPKSTAAALRVEVAALERDSKVKEQHLREAAREAAKALPTKRSELAQAEGYEEIESKLQEALGKRAALLGRPPADTKSAIFGWFTGGGHGFTFGMIFLAVLVIQLGQIVLPTVAGKAEIAAAVAGAAVIGQQAETPQVPAQVLAQAQALPTPPAPAEKPLLLAKPAPPPEGSLAAAAAALVADKGRRKAPAKAAAPKPTGLASKFAPVAGRG